MTKGWRRWGAGLALVTALGLPAGVASAQEADPTTTVPPATTAPPTTDPPATTAAPTTNPPATTAAPPTTAARPTTTAARPTTTAARPTTTAARPTTTAARPTTTASSRPATTTATTVATRATTTVATTIAPTTSEAPTTVPAAVPATTIAGGAGTDGDATRTVNRIIAALIALGALVLGLTIWYWKATTPLHPALEGLELMGSRRFLNASPVKREGMLERIRSLRGSLDDRVVGEGPPPRHVVGAGGRPV